MFRSALAFAVGLVALVAAQPATPLPPGNLHLAAPVAAHPLDASWSNRFGLPIPITDSAAAASHPAPREG